MRKYTWYVLWCSVIGHGCKYIIEDAVPSQNQHIQYQPSYHGSKFFVSLHLHEAQHGFAGPGIKLDDVLWRNHVHLCPKHFDPKSGAKDKAQFHLMGPTSNHKTNIYRWCSCTGTHGKVCFWNCEIGYLKLAYMYTNRKMLRRASVLLTCWI